MGSCFYFLKYTQLLLDLGPAFFFLEALLPLSVQLPLLPPLPQPLGDAPGERQPDFLGKALEEVAPRACFVVPAQWGFWRASSYTCLVGCHVVSAARSP